MLRRAAAMGSGYWRREAVGACTESLGSESGDVGGDAEIDQLPVAGAAAADEEGEEVVAGAGWVEPQPSPDKRLSTERRLPPAMPRAAEAFLRAERRSGRLILTEVVRAERREVFRASRADGRLQLRFADAFDDGDEPETESDGETKSVANGVVVGGCCNGGEFCQVAAGAGRRLEIGAVMGI